MIAGHMHAAADATDEAFARALERWPRVQSMPSPGGWTYRVALNLLRRRLRRERIEARLLGHMKAEPLPAPAGEAWDIVKTLPQRQRVAVVLRFLAGLTEEEIADAMGVRRSTVSNALAAARRNLVSLLDDADADLEATRA